MKKVNKTILDKEEGLVTVIQDEKTFHEQTIKRMSRDKIDGFNDCLFKLNLFLELTKDLKKIDVDSFRDFIPEQYKDASCFYIDLIKKEFERLINK